MFIMPQHAAMPLNSVRMLNQAQPLSSLSAIRSACVASQQHFDVKACECKLAL